MNPQLAAFFAKNKTVLLGSAAAGVAGLALLRKKNAGAAATTAGTIPAAAVVPAQATGGSYDSSAYDVYSALQSELGPILQQQAKATGSGTGSGVTTAPAPIASTLFAPTRTGNYIYQTPTNGAPTGVFEVEGDGSLYHLTAEDWGSIDAKDDAHPTKVGANIGSPFYTLEGNLSAKNGGTGASVFTTNAQGNYIPYVPKS